MAFSKCLRGSKMLGMASIGTVPLESVTQQGEGMAAIYLPGPHDHALLLRALVGVGVGVDGAGQDSARLLLVCGLRRSGEVRRDVKIEAFVTWRKQTPAWLQAAP